MVIKNNFIVITGGPGSGKSSVINKLSASGYQCIEETGRRLIKNRIDLNLSPRPEPEAFARQMFDTDFRHYKHNIATEQPIFFDRCFLDSAALLHNLGKAEDPDITDAIKNYRFCNKVFIAPPWAAIYENDGERDQTYEEAVATYKLMYNWYTANGYRLLPLPLSDVDSRTAFILQNSV
jgi:predicted ATPase